ncbi:DUF4175 family protein [Halocynthiibacter sp. C4]|uniref:DUF4175 domain-containing protein n=1 Tax=Halocynthiibacter sp. C4 TaxID=2992758 RepID=UPI00237B3467|nr:DUF4175 family protein [Halocynthiibacter sp. C4]MDE0590739.1 DUF4175 family protein [Halocynthiibacter sp. C4]
MKQSHAPKRAQHSVLKALRWRLRWTWVGMCADALLQAFWPLVSLALLVMGLGLLGVSAMLPETVFLIGAGFVALLGLILLVVGVRAFKPPSRRAALDRLDETLQGRPLAALTDSQTIGADDPASKAVWQTHLARMSIIARQARVPLPDLRLADKDPYALRLIAVLVFAVAVFFGSLGNLTTVPVTRSAMVTGPIASGAKWEGWIQPPRYTGLPNLYLNDLIGEDALEVAQGSLIQLRLYDQDGGVRITHSLDETGQDGATENSDFVVSRSGLLEVEGDFPARWDITMLPDQTPIIILPETAETTLDGELAQTFHGIDDFGVLRGSVDVELDLAAVDRRYGRMVEPDPFEIETYDLPMPLTRWRDDFEDVFAEDFAAHPWAGLPVRLAYSVEDGLGQLGQEFVAMSLPKRTFFNPLASAVAELRRDLLWARVNGPMVAQVLRAVSNLPEEMDVDSSGFLMLKAALAELETANADGLDEAEQESIANALWDVALRLEEGGLEDAKARLERARQRLSEAMERGAGEEEIAELMEELRDAMDDYMRQLAENAPNAEDQQTAQNDQGQEVTQDEIDALLEQIEALMEEGRMAEAQQLLDMLLEMMENMQIAQGQGEGRGQTPSDRAMDALEETLREQQELSDEAFRELQESYNPSNPNGQQQGQSEQQGQAPGNGGGESRSEDGESDGGEAGSQEGGGEGDDRGQGGGSLEDRQRALTDALRDQQSGGAGSGNDTVEDAMRRAERAMDEAGDALGESNIPGALNRQAEAIDALRDGLRELGEARAENGQGSQNGQAGRSAQNEGNNSGDPLGRTPGTRGGVGSDGEFANDPDAYERARDLMDEIQRRYQDQSRPQIERDYLERLLDDF